MDSTESSAVQRTNQEELLAELEERLAHEFMDDAGRQELRDRVLRLRRLYETRD